MVQYGPVPTTLVWCLLLGAFLAAIVLVAAAPEPGTVRPGALASLRPDISVPRPARGTFARAAPCLVAVWALGGFYLSLGPSLAAQLSGSRNLLWGGVRLPRRCVPAAERLRTDSGQSRAPDQTVASLA